MEIKIMKKVINIAIILVINIVFILLCNCSYAATGKINSETVRMRKGPSTDTGVIMLIAIDKEVEILGEEGEFYKVKYDKTTGYVSKSLIDVEKNNSSEDKKEEKEDKNTIPESNKEEQSEEKLNETVETIQQENFSKGEKVTLNNAIEIKILPVIYSGNIATIEEKTEITIIETLNNWYKIEKSDVIGWVRKENIVKFKEESKNISTEKVETNIKSEEENKEEKNTLPEENKTDNSKENKEQVKEQNNKIGYVNVDTVNVRKETNTSCSILGQLSKNTKVEILEELIGWYKIKSGNLTGYIASKYISDKKVADTTSRGTTEERKTAENTNNQDNVQKEEVTQSVQTPVVEESKENETKEPIKNTSSSKGEEVVALAKTFVGHKYVYGGSSPSTGFDCSGFTSYIYKQFGVTISRTSTAQAKNGIAVDKSNLQLGDLLIFNNEANTQIGHVGIYIGDNNFIHASNPKNGVKISSLLTNSYVKRYVGARRVL